MKFKVHPLFFALALAFLLFGQALSFAWTFVALLLHECAHALMAKSRGFIVKQMVLLPFGAMMSCDENFDKTSSVLIGLAGPACNVILALVTLGVWWLFPSIYPFTYPFFYANLSLGLFNLLPIYPLDGSRVVLGFCRNKFNAIKGLRIAGVVSSFVFLGVFVASFFFGLNFTYGVIAVFLFYSGAFATKEETYASVLESSCKNYSLGVEQKIVKMSKNTPIARFFHHISSTTQTTFEIVDDGGTVVATLDEGALKEVAIKHKLSLPIGCVVCADKMKAERFDTQSVSRLANKLKNARSLKKRTNHKR